MSNREITGSESLTLQILQLKEERTIHEEELSRTFNELKQLIFNPGLTVMEKRFEHQDRKRDLINLSKVVLNMGTDFIIEQSFGRRQKFRAFLTSIMMELASSPLINKKISKLFSGINRSLFGNEESIEI
jgi:hypothetical protein